MVILTSLTLLVAGVTLVVFYRQFKEMSKQTKILSKQAEQAAKDSATAAISTEKQIAIATRQASAAQNSVRVVQRQMGLDERAWIKAIPGYAEGKPVNVKWNIDQPVSDIIDITNIGKTAAQQVRIEVATENLNIQDAPTLAFRKGHIGITTIGDLYPVPDSLQVPVFWATNYDPEGQPKKEFLSVRDYNDLVDGKTYFVFYGRVRYKRTSSA